MTIKLFSSTVYLGLLVGFSCNAQQLTTHRTVTDAEAGAIFLANPGDISWKQFGGIVGENKYTPDSGATAVYDPDSVKAAYARFTVTKPNDDATTGFPYNALRAYDASETAKGRPSLFVTATYAGKKRPVLWQWSLKLDSNGHPTASPSTWEYALNLADDRFIKFWINSYIRSVLWNPIYGQHNVWFMLDDCAYLFRLYGVIDDTGKFVGAVPWNTPYAQSDSAYLASVAQFYNRVHQLAPDVRLMPNDGGIDDPNQVSTIYANVPGALEEDIYSWHHYYTTYANNPTTANKNRLDYVLNDRYNQQFRYAHWWAGQGKVVMLGAGMAAGDSQALLTSFATYEMLKGPNFFFAPFLAGENPYTVPTG